MSSKTDSKQLWTVETLVGVSNGMSWITSIQNALAWNGLWEVLSGDYDEPDKSNFDSWRAWKREDTKARALILRSMSPAIQAQLLAFERSRGNPANGPLGVPPLVQTLSDDASAGLTAAMAVLNIGGSRGQMSAVEVLSWAANLFGTSAGFNAFNQFKILVSTRLAPGEDPNIHFGTLLSVHSSLVYPGSKAAFSNFFFAMVLLESVPEDEYGFIIQQLTQKGEALTPEDVITAVTLEWQRHTAKECQHATALAAQKLYQAPKGGSGGSGAPKSCGAGSGRSEGGKTLFCVYCKSRGEHEVGSCPRLAEKAIRDGKAATTPSPAPAPSPAPVHSGSVATVVKPSVAASSFDFIEDEFDFVLSSDGSHSASVAISSAALAVTFPHTSSSKELLLDSGASDHMVNDASLVFDARAYGGSIRIGDDRTIPITLIGKMVLNTPHGSTLLQNVLVSPSLGRNLISVSRLARAGFHLHVTGANWTVTRNDVVALSGGTQHGVLVINATAGVNEASLDTIAIKAAFLNGRVGSL